MLFIVSQLCAMYFRCRILSPAEKALGCLHRERHTRRRGEVARVGPQALCAPLQRRLHMTVLLTRHSRRYMMRSFRAFTALALSGALAVSTQALAAPETYELDP